MRHIVPTPSCLDPELLCKYLLDCLTNCHSISFIFQELQHIFKDKNEDTKSLTNSLNSSLSGSGKKRFMSDKARKGWYYFFNTLAVLGQMAGLAVLCWGNFEFFAGAVKSENNTTTNFVPPEQEGEFINFREVVKFDQSTRNPYHQWLFALCLVLKSMTWWENFIDFDFTACGRVLIPFRSWKVRMHKLRQKTTVFTSLWNIAIILAFPYICFWHFKYFEFDVYVHNSKRKFDYQKAIEFAPAITNGLSAFIGYFVGGLSCKLFMQKPGFSVPLLISTPITALLILVQCFMEDKFIPDFGLYIWHCPEGIKTLFAHPDSIWQLACCGMFWISFLVITAYIWRPKHNPMDRNEKLVPNSYPKRYHPLKFHDLSMNLSI